jgi:hypothetical protein
MDDAPKDGTWVQVKMITGDVFMAFYGQSTADGDTPETMCWLKESAGSFWCGIPDPQFWRPQ